MVNKSTTNVSTDHQDNDGLTTAMLNDGGNKNNSDLDLKTGYQRPSSREDINNFFITEPTFWARVFSWRSFIIFLLHLSSAIQIIPMVTMSMALMCMCGPIKGPTNGTLNNSRLSPYTEFTALENITLSQEKVYEFNWDSEIRGLLISGGLFLAFLGPQFANLVRSYIGNKLTLTILSLSSAFLSLVSPIAARTSVYFLLTFRILSGFLNSTNYPILMDTLAWWIPAKEKLTSSTIVVSGSIVGGSFGPLIAGYLCKTGVDNGWSLIFYFHGVVYVVWTIAWYFLSSRKPENHSYISEKEKTYILAHRLGMHKANTKTADKPPYRTILTSRPVLAYIITNMLKFWSLVIIYTCLPLYLTSVLKFSLPEAGSIFFVIFFLRLPGIFLSTAFGNWLLDRKHMSTNKVRKICLGLAQGLTTIFCVVVSFLDDSSKWLASVVMGAVIISANFGTVVSNITPLDLAPRYAGFISGLGLSLGGLVAMTAPLVATAITKQGSFEQWRVVWICMAICNLLAGLVFLIFGNASLQSWAVPETVPPIVKVNDQSSSDLKLKTDSEAASLQPDKPDKI